MRKLGLAFSSLLPAPPRALACSSPSRTTRDAGADLTDEDLAKAALKLMGAPQLPRESAEQASCSFTGCHSISNHAEGLAGPVQGRDRHARERPAERGQDQLLPSRTEQCAYGLHAGAHRHPLRRRPPRARCATSIRRAAGDVTTGASSSPRSSDGKERPLRRVQKRDVDAGARRTVSAPHGFSVRDSPHLVPEGPPARRTTSSSENRPTHCVDNFEQLKARTSEVKNADLGGEELSEPRSDVRLPSAEPGEPGQRDELLRAAAGDGKDIFPEAVEHGVRSHLAAGRLDHPYPPRVLGPELVLGPHLGRRPLRRDGWRTRPVAPRRSTSRRRSTASSRDIGLQASYDPDFWPDNKAFMFQGGNEVLRPEPPREAEHRERQRSASRSARASAPRAGLYQTVGQVVGDNSISDRFILYSIWAGDSGRYSTSARDTPPRGSEDSAINIYTAVAQGNDVEEGYQIAGDPAKGGDPVPRRHDDGPLGKLIGSRWALRWGGRQDGRRLRDRDARSPRSSAASTAST